MALFQPSEIRMKTTRRMAVAAMALLLACAAFAKDVVIDVRTPQEFQGGHIEGALNLPHDSIAQDIAKAKVAKDDHVILYCRSGRRSELAMNTLKGLGFSNIENYGGFEQAQKRLQKP
jgi:phage shock protein E